MWLKLNHVSKESLDSTFFHKFIATHMDGDAHLKTSAARLEVFFLMLGDV